MLKTERIIVSLNKDFLDKLKKESLKKDETVSFYVRKSIMLRMSKNKREE